ncbi:MAG: nucleotide exchange factor GrpE [Gammaproteobacteria bacterium]|nr:nucleotide exchange factor GrpE [Gammaproteobacteria bacterium]
MTAEETVGDNNRKPPESNTAPEDAQVTTGDGDGGDGGNDSQNGAANDAAPEQGAEASDTELDFGQDRMNPEPAGEADLETDADPLADLQAQLAAATTRADENWERVLRMQADMENQRKRSQKDVENARKFAMEGLINDLLPIRDSLEMGIAAARESESDAEKIIEGSDLTLKMMSQTFEKYNINVIDPLDQKFDPEFHQAMSMQDVEGKESNTVTSVLQKGYTLNDRLLRPALVMVAK